MDAVKITHHFFKIVLVDGGGKRQRFLGSCFPITPNGDLLTCRHVVDIDAPQGLRLAVEDGSGAITPVFEAPILASDERLDMAVVRTGLDETRASPFAILTPNLLKIGADVYSYGFFTVGGVGEPEAGYFSGTIVNFTNAHDPERAGVTLPFAVLEGMSGSPILTYRSGVRLVGVATGNRQSRIVVSETVEVDEGNERHRETLNRIVEHGTGYHPQAIISFLASVGVSGFEVSG